MHLCAKETMARIDVRRTVYIVRKFSFDNAGFLPRTINPVCTESRGEAAARSYLAQLQAGCCPKGWREGGPRKSKRENSPILQ